MGFPIEVSQFTVLTWFTLFTLLTPLTLWTLSLRMNTIFFTDYWVENIHSTDWLGEPCTVTWYGTDGPYDFQNIMTGRVPAFSRNNLTGLIIEM